MDKDLSDVLISGGSEDYTIDDVITIGGTNTPKANPIVHPTNAPAQTPAVVVKTTNSGNTDTNTSATVNTTTSNTVPIKMESIPVSSPPKQEKVVPTLIPQDKNVSMSKEDFENIETTMKDMVEKLSTKVSPNINKFVLMTKCENDLKELYSDLENISKNRGSAKEIIEIGSKIQVLEEEKDKQFINDKDVDDTIENIRNTISLLGKFKNMLEVSRSLKN